MLDKPAARPKGRPRKQPGAETTRKARATFCGAARVRLKMSKTATWPAASFSMQLDNPASSKNLWNRYR